MRPIQIAGLVLVALGVAALLFAAPWTTGQESSTVVGPLEVKVRETKQVTVPSWAGIGAIVLGGVLVVVPLLRKRS
jgi:uncharacterized membrane protein